MPLTLEDFKPDEHVLYIPTHAHGDRNHPDCEYGIVSSIGKMFVFVHYIKNGIVQSTGQATDPVDLIKI